MVFAPRVFRIVWISLALILLGIPAVLFVASKAVERALLTERHLGEWSFRFYGVKISPLLGFRADSVWVASSHERIFASGLSEELLEISRIGSRRAIVRLTIDSADVRFSKRQETPKTSPKFPAIKFPLPVLLEWRVLQIHPEGGPDLFAEQARWRSHGPWGLGARFRGGWKMAQDTVWNHADFILSARWTGPRLRYDIEVLHETDTLKIVGVREKNSLLLGEDSLHFFSENPREWVSDSLKARLPELGPLRIEGKIDWKRRKVLVVGQLHTGAFHVLEPFSWNWTLQSDSIGGRVNLHGHGIGHQSFSWQGGWEHPPEWLTPPDWKRYAAAFSGRVAGIHWQIGTRNLPIEFVVSSLRLEPGLAVTARIVTRDSSHFEAHWNGEHPRKLEFSGPVSPHETWATIWTDTNLHYHSARVQGVWEDGKLKASAWFNDVRAYGAEADSVEAVQDVTSTGYYLKEARLFRQGEVFRGSGQVEWAPHPGWRGPSLAFKLTHPEFGRVSFAMPYPDSMIAVAESTQAALFPYLPLQRFARFHPVVSGHFFWNHITGAGKSDADVVFSYREKELKASADATWDKDSLRFENAQIRSGTSRLNGGGALSLNGLSLAGFSHLRPDAVGSWHLNAENVQVGEVIELAHPTEAPVVLDGVLDGNLGYEVHSGWTGTLKATDVRLPALSGLMEIRGLSLSGQGDSLQLTAFSTSTRHALLSDTLVAHLSGLRSESPHLGVVVHSGPLFARFAGNLSGWKTFNGNAEVTGRAQLGGAAGSIDEVRLEGDLSIPFIGSAGSGARFASRFFQLRYIAAVDTQWLDGYLNYGDGIVTAPDLRVRHSQGGEVNGQLEARLAQPVSVNFSFSGPKVTAVLPNGQEFKAQDVSGKMAWVKGGALKLSGQARSGSFKMPGSSVRVESGFERLRLELSIPPADATELPKVLVRGRVRDFLFQRKDLQAFVRSFGRTKAEGSGASNRRSKPWETDLALEAVGTNNHIETDILRFSFLGDLEVKGVYPYTLFNGKLTGLQGEIGPAGRVYDVRDLEVKWENSTLDEGTVYVEGDKKLRADCAPTTQRTCTMFIKLNGRLDEMNFSYDTDCGQNVGEPIPPTVLINSMTQGCYSAESGGGWNNEKAAINLAVEPTLNYGLSKGVKWASGGIIQSTQVSGLSSFMNSDTAGVLEQPVALEVQTREKYRVSLKGKAGYHPEVKLADPWEYKLALEYRPPLERLAKDSLWQTRFRDRVTLETSVETRPPEVRDEEVRQVREQVGLRYHYRFWDLW